MTGVSKQVSLREIVGTTAPGAMVIASVLFAMKKIPGIGGSVDLSGAPGTAMLIGLVLAYCIGTLLKSSTEFVFQRVTQLTAGPTPATTPDAPIPPPSGWAARAAVFLEPRVRRLAMYLGGGKNIAASNKEFRESWHRLAVRDGAISPHLFTLATGHYRSLFGNEPEGEEGLVMCEYYIRQQTPGAMQEIEENAAKAALMGNLFIPMLFALFAVGIGFVFDVIAFAGGLPGSLVDLALVAGILAQAFVFVLVIVAFPYVVNMIGQQWSETSMARVKLILVAFTVACRINGASTVAAG
jgi:hypothetical protein